MSDERMERARQYAEERMGPMYEEFLVLDWQAPSPPTPFQAAIIKAHLLGECFAISAGHRGGKTTVREAVIRNIQRMERLGL